MRLIDADALKETLKSNCDLCHDKNTNWCENCCPHNDFEDLIDNAPAVDPDKALIANVTFDENKLKEIVQTEVIDKIKSGELVLKAERPQGEWNEIQAGMFACPFCGARPHKDFKNFCAKCGADMQKGGVE